MGKARFCADWLYIEWSIINVKRKVTLTVVPKSEFALSCEAPGRACDRGKTPVVNVPGAVAGDR